MIAPPRDRTGLVIVRVWVEEDGFGSVVARITSTLDLSRPGQTVTTASSIDQISAVVQDFLQTFMSP